MDINQVDIKIRPHEDMTNGWSAILPPRTTHATLQGPLKADWLIIGGGYAGLSAGRRLAENRPNDSIVILEGGECGNNASGRNSGFAIDVPHNVGSSTAELEKAMNYQRLMKAGIVSLEQIVKSRGIECNWSVKGKYHCAAAPHLATTILKQHAYELDTLKEPFEWLEQTQLRDRLGTAFFHAGIYTPGCILLNPAALTRGLADSLPENVKIYENSAVAQLEYGESVSARTPQGIVTARKLIIASNGGAGQLPGFKRQLFNVASYGSLTEPLTAAQRALLGNVDEWGVTPVNAISGATMRYTQDHRILIRQRFDFTPAMQVGEKIRERARNQHRQVFLARFPELQDVKLEHFWMGYFSITKNGSPRWGKVDKNVYAAVGCNGVGIAKQTIAGLTLADLACGVQNELIGDMLELGSPQRLPPKPLLNIGVKAYLAKERWVGRHEF